MSEPTDAPIVFMSYSHDDPEHKAWVERLAADLRQNGVNAILDQWERRLGGDLHAFMERGISGADRVCIICTPEYRRKANGGQGGVGYEKQIVTGEFYHSLDTDKFIPVLRHGSPETALPTFLASRLFCDFRADSEYAEKLEELVRDIHNTPKSRPPPIGNNPFSIQEVVANEQQLSSGEPKTSYSIGTRAEARELIRRGDLMGWKDLLRSTKRTLCTTLLDTASSFKSESRYDLLTRGTECCESLFAIALAGVESEMQEYSDQRDVIAFLLGIPEWPRRGLTTVVDFPRSLAFIFQYLHGALAIELRQHHLAVSLASMRVPGLHQGLKPLYACSDLAGWPSLLSNAGSLEVLDYIESLPKRVGYLHDFFSGSGKTALLFRAYNMILCALAFARMLVDPAKVKQLKTAPSELRLGVPPVFLHSSYNNAAAVSQLAFPDPDVTSLVVATCGISAELLNELWPRWLDYLAGLDPKVWPINSENFVLP